MRSKHTAGVGCPPRGQGKANNSEKAEGNDFKRARERKTLERILLEKKICAVLFRKKKCILRFERKGICLSRQLKRVQMKERGILKGIRSIK